MGAAISQRRHLSILLALNIPVMAALVIIGLAADSLGVLQHVAGAGG